MPVNADLSDLEEKIQWCRDHDAECKQIGQNAMKFYEKYVARNVSDNFGLQNFVILPENIIDAVHYSQALLDYVQMACRHMAKRQVSPPDWWKPAPPEEKPPKLTKPDGKCFEDHATRESRYCTRCQEEVDEEERAKAKEAEEAQKKKRDAGSTKKRLRDRMKKRAKQS